jgi:hypothetical protein
MTDPINMMIQLLQILIPLILGIILFSSTLMSKWRWLVAILLFIGGSSPFLYFLFDEQLHPVLNANIDLELSMFFAWGCSAILVIIAFIRIFVKLKSQKPR